MTNITFRTLTLSSVAIIMAMLTPVQSLAQTPTFPVLKKPVQKDVPTEKPKPALQYTPPVLKPLIVTPTKPVVQKNQIKAAFVSPENSKHYFFTSDRYFRYGPKTKFDKAANIKGNWKKATNIKGNWDGIPDDFDAAFVSSRNKKAYFFKGSKYYRYSFSRGVDNNILRISRFWKGVPNNIDAVVEHPNGKVYFFKGDTYYRFNSDKKMVDETAKISRGWSGVPNNIDAALLHANGKIYLFKGDKYYRFNIKASRVDRDATIGNPGWLGLDFTKKNFVKKPPKKNKSYKEEERAAQKETDACGPESLPNFEFMSYYFLDVCKKHDACYRLQKKSQRFCDNQMRAEMDEVCASVPLHEKLSCWTNATIFGEFIESTYGGQAYGGKPQGKIAAVERKVIKDWFSDDEVDYCVRILNNSKITQEYEVRLVNNGGEIIDREPDTYELTILSGLQDTICVGTNMLPGWSQSDLSSTVTIQLLADTPNSSAISGDMVVVDSRPFRGR